MQDEPRYDDVVKDVGNFLLGRAEACRGAGIGADRILLDPGFGFGKTLRHNLQLLHSLGQLAGQYPLLVGLSRKAMLGKLLGRSVEQRLPGSLALATLAVAHGARIVRCHDVAETLDAVRVAWAVGNAEAW
jgi:dihydropteroate synthase